MHSSNLEIIETFREPLMKLLRIYLPVFLLVFQVSAQVRPLQPIRGFRVAHEHQILGEFMDLLAIPNVASDSDNIRKNVAKITEMMRQRGIKPE